MDAPFAGGPFIGCNDRGRRDEFVSPIRRPSANFRSYYQHPRSHRRIANRSRSAPQLGHEPMTYTATQSAAHTRTHTATHLADVILGSIADILGTLGLDPTSLFADWNTDQRAISNWIYEGSVTCVTLECHRPNGVVSPIFEFPVSYIGSGEGDRKFTVDRAALARYLAKLQTVPVGTTYRLFCCFHGPHSPQVGWSAGRRASTSGMQLHSFGTLATGPHGRAALRYFRR